MVNFWRIIQSNARTLLFSVAFCALLLLTLLLNIRGSPGSLLPASMPFTRNRTAITAVTTISKNSSFSITDLGV